MRRLYVKNIRSLVVKVGTSTLTRGGRFDPSAVTKIVDEIAVFLKKGVRVSVVSSGAIGAGMTLLKEKERPRTMEGLQAAAAVGQPFLMQCYQKAFTRHGFPTAQVLLTWDDLARGKRHMNAKRTLAEIQRRGAVPIINENDTVAVDEIRFGDNDQLSALLSILIEADVLVILQDTDGFREAGGRGRRLSLVRKIDKALLSHVEEKKNSFTMGGMSSKVEAVRMCARSGIPVFLARGRARKVLTRLFEGEDIGTLFSPRPKRGKSWAVHFLDHIRRGWREKKILGRRS